MYAKKTSLFIVILLSAAAFTYAAPTIDMPAYGFSIETLDSKPSVSTSTMALMQFLPVTEGFGPNINVVIQPYPGSIKDFGALSKDQFKKMNWVIISEKQIGDVEWMVEYKGPMNGRDLHFYARAISIGSKVYLVTATAKDSQWDSVGSILRSRVDSFKTK